LEGKKNKIIKKIRFEKEKKKNDKTAKKTTAKTI
jgi:hypothetical protein